MSVNLLTEVRNTLDQDITKSLAEIIDEHPEKTLDAVTAAVPALVNAMCQKAETIDGAEQVFRAVGEFDGGMVKNFRMIVESGEYQDLADAGTRLSQRITGDETDKVVDVIANYSFIEKEAAEKLVKLLTPLLLAIAGDQRRVHGLNRNGVTQMLQAQQSFFALELPPETLNRLNIENPFTEAEKIADSDMFIPRPDADFVPPIRTDHSEAVANTSSTTIIDPPDVSQPEAVQADDDVIATPEASVSQDVADAAEAETIVEETEAEKHARAVRDTLAAVIEPQKPEPTEEQNPSEEAFEEQTAGTPNEEETPFFQPIDDMPETPAAARSDSSTESKLENEADNYRYLDEDKDVKIATSDLVMKAILPVLAVSALWFYTHTMFGRRPGNDVRQLRPVSHQVTTQVQPLDAPDSESPAVEISLDELESLAVEMATEESTTDADSYVAVSTATVMDGTDSSVNNQDATDYAADDAQPSSDDPFAQPIAVDPPAVAKTAEQSATTSENRQGSGSKPTFGMAMIQDIAKQSDSGSQSVGTIETSTTQTPSFSSSIDSNGQAGTPTNYFLVGNIKVPVFAKPRKTGRSYYSQAK